MDALCGTWELASSEGLVDYMIALGVTPEQMQKSASLEANSPNKPTQEISVDGDTWTLKTFTAVGNKEMSFKLGAEFEDVSIQGVKGKYLFTADGNTMVESFKMPSGENVGRRTANGDEMTYELIFNGVKCTRKYKRA